MDLGFGQQLAKEGAKLPSWVHRIDSNQYSPQHQFNRVHLRLDSSNALRTTSIDKALIKFFVSYCAHIVEIVFLFFPTHG